MPPQGMASETRWTAHSNGNAVDGPVTETRWTAHSNGNAVSSPVTETRWARVTETVIVQYAPTGHRIPAQGIALGTASQRISVF